MGSGNGGNVKLAIEYHGAGHMQGNVSERDKPKEIVLGKAGIPMIVINEKDGDSEILFMIKAKIQQSPGADD